MQEALKIIIVIANGMTLVGCGMAALVNLVAPNPPMAHWPLNAALAATIGVTLLGVKSGLTIIYFANEK